MLREGATCEVLRDILGRVNIDATQIFFAPAEGTNYTSSGHNVRHMRNRPTWAAR
jgi:hypothetical protein